MAGGGGTGKYPLVDRLGGIGMLMGDSLSGNEAGEKVCGSQLAVANFRTSPEEVFGKSGLNPSFKLAKA